MNIQGPDKFVMPRSKEQAMAMLGQIFGADRVSLDTKLPTSEDIEKRLPFKSDSPVSQAATGLGQIGGGFYTGPMSGARAMTAIPKAVGKAGRDFVMAAPQGAPRMFIGPKAKTWDQAAADAAARMEKQGVDPVDIWRQTKTFRGADGIQRQEISDRASHLMTDSEREQAAQVIESGIDVLKQKIKPSKQKDLFPKALTEAKREVRDRIYNAQSELINWNQSPRIGVKADTILSHPELYKAYPELGEIQVVTGGYGGNAKGMLSRLPGGGGGKGWMGMDIFDAGMRTDPKSTALHEMQHAVQTIEGMSPGGSSSMAFQDPEAFKILENLRARALTPMSFDDYAKQYSHLANKEAGYQDYLKSIPSIVKGIDRELQSQAAREYYQRLAGEAEARATQARRGMSNEQRAQEYPYSSYDVLEEDLLTKPPFQYAKGGEVKMAGAGRVEGSIRPTEVQNKGALGLANALKKAHEFASKPFGYANPPAEMISELLGIPAVSRTLERMGYGEPLTTGKGMTLKPKDDTMDAALTVLPMAKVTKGMPGGLSIKNKGGNFLTDRLGRELQYLKPTDVVNSRQYQYGPEMEKAVRQRIAELNNDIAAGFGGDSSRSLIDHLQQKLDSGEIAQKGAINNWVDRNLTNYIKNQMATPEDPVRLMLDKRTGEIEAKFAKDMERADRLAERAAAETDPRMKVNLTRNAEQAKMAAEMERDLAMSHILPTQELTIHAARSAAGEAKVNRAVEGFPEEGMAKSPAGKAWEDITDSDMGVTANRAGDAQSAAEKVQKAKEASEALANKADEIDQIFEQRLRGMGELTEEEISALMRQTAERKLRVIRDPDLADSYRSLQDDLRSKNSSYEINDLNISRDYPWVSKLDPEARIYEFRGSGDLGFDHIIDVLKQDVAAGRITPDQLNRMSVDQAVRRAAEYDKELAEKMNSARAAAREGLPVYKEYPEGYRWVELNKPGSFASESEAMGHSVRGYEPPKGHPDWVEGAGDSGSEYYGHGGWEGIKSGKAKVYSLVDPKGAPHVTVEVKRPESVSEELQYKYRDKINDKINDYLIDNPDATHEEAMSNALAQLKNQFPSSITQIKGKQNTRPNEKYDQYTQDFVKSGNWSDVRDLGNTGLMPLERALAPGDFNRVQSLGNLPKYVTQQEADDLLNRWMRENPVGPKPNENWLEDLYGGAPPEGMKRGGRVSISDNADSQMMDVLDKKMAGGGLLKGLKTLVKQELPAVNRVEMNYKDVTKRVPELTEAAKKIPTGEMSAEEYSKLVNQFKPVTPYEFVPQPATAEDATRALTANKKAMFGKTKEIPAGQPTDLRLDIPAYRDHGVWVNSVHRKGEPTVYGSVSSVKNATMSGAPDKALRVATGEAAKGPWAVISGEWNPLEEAAAVESAQKYLNHKDWRQVGYDPERHGYFYDRETMAPILGAEEVIQIGPLVLAKKPKIGDPKDFPFKQGGEVHMGAGGILSKLAKAMKGAQEVLPAAEREGNLAKMLESSAVKQRMIHGSSNPNIKQLKTGKMLKEEQYPGNTIEPWAVDNRDAVFLTPEPTFSNNYAGGSWDVEIGRSPTSYPVYVQAKKPWDYDNPKHIEDVIQTYKQKFPLAKYGDGSIPSDESMRHHQFEKNLRGLSSRENNWSAIENAELQNIIKDLGYDSFYVKEAGAKNLGVYDPKKIKSAIGNRGTYDTSKPDLNEATGGLIKVKNKRKARG
jgi:hypothetical protein